MATGLKHLVTCRCVLQQFKQRPNPPAHMFTVFSVIDDNDVVCPSYAQCNNCGIIHKVTEVNRSTIVPKESMKSLMSIDDIKASLPSKLTNLLEMNDVDLATWQMASFIIEEKQWGTFVVLTSEQDDSGSRQGKYVRILGESMFKVEQFSREENVG